MAAEFWYSTSVHTLSVVCSSFECCLVHHGCLLAISSIIHVTSPFTQTLCLRDGEVKHFIIARST